MSLWTWLQNTPPSTPSVPNDNPPETVTGGDPDGVDLTDFDNLPASRALPRAVPSAWPGWPSEWSTPAFTAQLGINKLVDIAWAALDLNSSILSSMPVYRLRGGQIIDPATWMVNPDPAIYTSWQEFCKQLLWDYMLGEVFVLPIVRGADGWPMRFRVIPPWLIEVEMRGGTREYKLGSVDVTNDILHIRYTSSTDNARGVGPLQCAGARQTTIGLLQRYSNRLAETGGTLKEWFNVDRRINRSEAADLMESYIESRTKYAGYPGLVGSGATLNQGQSMSATDMALLELSQFNESRIAVLLGFHRSCSVCRGPVGRSPTPTWSPCSVRMSVRVCGRRLMLVWRRCLGGRCPPGNHRIEPR